MRDKLYFVDFVMHVGRTQKGRTTLPGHTRPPGPHGHPDVVLPICTRLKGRKVADTKSAAIHSSLGLAKAPAMPLGLELKNKKLRVLETAKRTAGYFPHRGFYISPTPGVYTPHIAL